MESVSVVLVLSAIVFILIFVGIRSLISIKRSDVQKEEAERIFRQRVIKGEEMARAELNQFFYKTRKPIMLSALSFVASFILSVVVARTLWPSNSFWKTLVSLGIFLLVFGGPLMMSVLADLDIIYLKKDLMKRFNED